MRRDMDLIRSLLLVIERGTEPQKLPSSSIIIQGIDEATIACHIGMLVDAELIEAGHSRSGTGSHDQYLIRKLTWKGHEFIGLARNDTTWMKARSRAEKVGGALSLEVFKQVLADVAKDLIA